MLTFLVTHTCGVNTLQKQLEPIPAPDTTALVTLRDKPLGGNDIMPRVQVRCWRQKYQNILYIYKPKDPICETGSNTGQDGIGHT